MIRADFFADTGGAIVLLPIDNLQITGDRSDNVTLSFSSTDSTFNGLTETLSVNVIDNDFRRSLENNKLPSAGNNYIIYDFIGTSANYTSTDIGNAYDLNAGNDKLEITGLFQGTLASAYITGNDGNDTVSGGTIIDGGSGDDNLITFSTGVNNHIHNGNARNYNTARIAGGTGNDSITAGNVSLVAAGGSGADSIKGSTVNDILWGDGYEGLIRTKYDNAYSRGDFYDWNSLALNFYGQHFFNTSVSPANSGADFINAGLGDDWVDAGAGNNTIVGDLGNDTLISSTGNDSIDGGDGNDSISSGFGNDSINAGSGDNTINADSGNDTITSGTGNDTITAGEGFDLIVADDGNNSIDAGGDDDTITSGGGNDIITAGSGDDSVSSGAGNDNINAGDGNNTVIAGLGNDTLSGGLGVDILYGQEDNDQLSGNEANDSLYGGDGADTLHGGAGDDLLDAGSGASNALYGEAGKDTLTGSDGADLAYGGDNNDLINTAAGNDSIYGDAGNDTLNAGEGNNLLDGGTDNDSLTAASGNDTLSGGSGSDVLNAGDGNNSLDGGLGNDSLTAGEGNNLLDGGLGNDILISASGSDTISGGAGDDSVSSGGGNDIITAGDGNDTVNSGLGNDTLSGGLGADILSGGAGSDTFSYTGENLSDPPDTITDFTAGNGGDNLDLNQLHTSNPLVSFPAANYPFSLGYIRLLKDGSDTLITYDKDGFNGAYQPQIISRLINVNPTVLTPDNFVAGAASTNFGFQRNGAIVGITATTSSAINYSVRLWGGQPAASVNVNITDKQGNSSIGTFTFNSSNWDQTQTLSIANSISSARPTGLQDLKITITSSDVNYQGTGLALGFADNELVAQRLPLTQINLPVFDPDSPTRELLLSSSSDLTKQDIPQQLRLIPISGSGPGTTATTSLVNSSTLRLTLAPDSSAWVGNTTYNVEPSTTASATNPLSFRVQINQAQNYKVTLSTANASLNEGSDGKSTIFRVTATLDSTALSDIRLNWKATGNDIYSASADDFAANTSQAGTITIRKGSHAATIEIPIQADLIQEDNETFQVAVTNSSDQVIDTSNASTTLSILNDDLSTLTVTGTIKYWKNNEPINSVQINLNKNIANASPDRAIQFSNIIRNDSTGIITASLWADLGSQGFSNVNFSFVKNTDPSFNIAINTSLFTDQWITAINQTSDRYSLSSVSLEKAIGKVRIADVTISQGNDLSTMGSAYLEYGRVGDTLLQETHINESQKVELLNGQFGFLSTAGSFAATIKKDPITGIQSRTIDSQDALMALKMSSGAITASNLESQAQWIAADVDMNSIIQAKDAWLINKYAVGDTTIESSSGSWQFINANTSISNLGVTNASAPKDGLINQLSITSNPQNVNILAILNGDINGSYASIN